MRGAKRPRRIAVVCVALALVLLAAACAGKRGNPEGEALRLGYQAVFDPFAGDVWAYRFLAPEGWTVAGPGVVWNIGLRNGGVSASLDVFDPDPARVRGFNYIPYLPHYWSDPAPALIPEGQVYSTVGAVITRPLSAVEYLELITIPQNFGPDTQLIGSQQLPDLAVAVAQAYGLANVDAARSRIVFNNGSRDLEAHVYAWTSYQTINAGGLTSTAWQPELIYMVYAANGQLELEEPFLNTLALSFIVNPEWLNVVNTVERLRVEGEARIQEELNRLIDTLRETSDATFDLTTEGFRQRQESNDRIFENMTEAIRGTETYADPGVGNIELPGGFEEVWSTGTGDWVLSNDPLFDPNINSNVDWELIRPSQ